MKQKPWEIYTLSDPRTGEIRYVGVTFRARQRFNEHLSRATRGGKTHRDCWIRSLIDAGVRPVYQVIECGQGDGWQEKERIWIAHYRINGRLTNLTDGGEGTPGTIPSQELRQKWSKMRTGVPYAAGRESAMKGKHHTPEAREKIRLAGIGRKQSEEAKTKLSQAMIGKTPAAKTIAASVAVRAGRPLTEAHKQKIAATTTNRKAVIIIETGQIFDSITAASRALQVNEQSVRQAARRGVRCKGYHFRFL